MSQQSLFTTVTLSNANSANTYVKTGFTPGYIKLVNYSAMQASPHVAGHGYEAMWQTGMANGTCLNATFLAAVFSAVPNYVATNGITLLNPLGSETAQYGAIVSDFTNAGINTAVITVDSTSQAGITVGCVVRVAALADDQSTAVSLNGTYTVYAVTETTITVVQATTGSCVYVSGGFVTLLQNANAIIPNPPNNIYSNVPTVFNESIQGFVIGTGVFPSAGTHDIILVSCWDQMQP